MAEAEPSRARFAGARSAELDAPAGSTRVLLAERFALRFLGLMRVDEAAAPALLFPRCASIHTFWMRFAIDVCFLDSPPEQGGEVAVLAVHPRVGRRRSLALGRRERDGLRTAQIAVLELGPGRAAALGIEPGARLSVSAPAGAPPR